MTNKPRVYEGRLAEPLGAPPSILGSEDLEAESAAYDAEIKLRLDLLMEHYGISQTAPDRWQALALRLAQVHVPGLRPYRYPNSANGTVFVAMRVTYLMKFRGFSVAAATSAIAEIWPELGTAEAVRLHYRESKLRRHQAGIYEALTAMITRTDKQAAKDALTAGIGKQDLVKLDSIEKPRRGRPRK